MDQKKVEQKGLRGVVLVFRRRERKNGIQSKQPMVGMDVKVYDGQTGQELGYVGDLELHAGMNAVLTAKMDCLVADIQVHPEMELTPIKVEDEVVCPL
jgi:hypothetical protein